MRVICGDGDKNYPNLYLPDGLWIAKFNRQSQVNPRFLWYLIISQAIKKTLGSLAIGTSSSMKNIAQEDLLNLKISLPQPSEQQLIVHFLDQQIFNLDSLVSKKLSLSNKLKEKRTALISRTVTRGLPPETAQAAGLEPYPKFKNSGIEWLGEVPEHWDIITVGLQFRNLDHRRIPVSGEDRATIEKVYPYYGASGIIDYVDDYLFDETLILVAEDGANLLSRSTPLAFLASGKYWVNNHAHILKPRNGDIRYWMVTLQTFDYSPLVTGAAQPKLTSERLSSIKIPHPPIEEQRIIADHLDHETAKIDKMIAKVQEAIERLQEYRSALITAAVTGKIDVRGVMQNDAGKMQELIEMEA